MGKDWQHRDEKYRSASSPLGETTETKILSDRVDEVPEQKMSEPPSEKSEDMRVDVHEERSESCRNQESILINDSVLVVDFLLFSCSWMSVLKYRISFEYVLPLVNVSREFGIAI